MQKSEHAFDAILYPLICLVTSIAFFCFSPYRVPDPHRDSGIFLYLGSEILRGKVLYLQAWDIKQPLVYFIDAIGIWFGRGSLWGVWDLELVFLLTTFLAGYRILRLKLPPFSSFFVIALSFFTVFPFFGGNYTEEYALLFQMGILAILCFVYLPNRKIHSQSLAAFGIGVLAGLIFLIKQTYLDITVSVVLFILFLAWVEQNRRILTHILLMGLGFALANLPFWLYFFLHGALKDYLIGAFLYNRYYVSLGLLELIHAILEKIEFITSTPVFMLISSVWLASVFLSLIRGRKFYLGALANPVSRWAALAAGGVFWGLFAIAQVWGTARGVGLLEWVMVIAGTACWIAAFFLFLMKNAARSQEHWSLVELRKTVCRIDWHQPGPPLLLFLGLIDLPVATFFIALSGKDFTHYYISLFPAVFLLLAGGLSYVLQFAVRASQAVTINTLLAALLVAGLFGPLLQINTFLSNPGKGDARFAAAAYLKSVTIPKDKILVWGWEAVIYFLADREAPTRYAIQFPAYLDSPYQPEVLSTLLADLQKDQPLYIADTLDAGMPLTEGRSGSDCLSGSRVVDDRLRTIISFVCSNYEFDRSFENIYIYKHKPPIPGDK